jgi:hypothetical protein
MKIGDLITIRGGHKRIGVGVVTVLHGGHNNEYHQVYIDNRKLWVHPNTLEAVKKCP